MSFKPISVIAAAAFLSGCMQNAPISGPPVEMALKTPQVNSARILGYNEPIIRTSVIVTSEQKKRAAASSSNPNSYKGERREIAGAACTADSAELSASFTTPATLRIPKFKGKPTTLRITCRANGETATYKMDPTLDGVIIAGASVAGLVAAAVTAGVAASKDSWSYGANDISVWVPFKPKSEE